MIPMPESASDARILELQNKVSILEARIREYDAATRDFYRTEWSKIDVLIAKVNALGDGAVIDRSDQKRLEARILKCETQILSLKAEFLSGLGDLEKKFLRWVAVSAAISGATGASVIKIFQAIGF